MQTGDGLLVRLNPVAGGVSPKALIGLCEAARRHGNGIIEVTARGSLQIRGLTAESATLMAAEVDSLGIAVRTGVPVETGPLAGLDPDEIADPTPLAAGIRAAIDAAGLGGRLGPKVSVVIDGGGQLAMDTVQADVRLTALAPDLWLLAAAGDARTATLIGTVTEAEAGSATPAILHAIAERGREARARDLKGQEIRELVSAFLNPDESKPELHTLNPPSPIGILPLANGASVLGLGLPFGHTQATRMIALCREAEALGAREIRFALQRAILVLGLSQSGCDALQGTAKSLGFITDALDPRRMIAACPGAPACASGRIASRDIAEEIARDSGAALDASVTLHISGCAKGCAHPAAATLTLVGDEKGAGLVVDGTAKGLPAAYTPGYELARGFGRIAVLLDKERRAGESAAQCIERLGESRLAAAFQQG